MQLGERRRLVGHRAQHQAGDRRVARLVFGGKPVRDRVEHGDRHRGVGRRAPRLLAQVGLGLDRQHLGHRGWVVGEVGSGAGAELQHAAREPRKQLTAPIADVWRLLPRHQRVQAREQRVAHPRLHASTLPSPIAEVSLCAPAALELVRGAPNPEAAAKSAERLGLLQHLRCGDEAWERAGELHYDADFERIAAVGKLSHRWLAARGALT